MKVISMARPGFHFLGKVEQCYFLGPCMTLNAAAVKPINSRTVHQAPIMISVSGVVITGLFVQYISIYKQCDHSIARCVTQLNPNCQPSDHCHHSYAQMIRLFVPRCNTASIAINPQFTPRSAMIAFMQMLLC